MSLLKIVDLKTHYKKNLNHIVKALDGVSFDVHSGEILGIVGESGCGKSTLVKTLMGLENKTSGHIFYRDQILDQTLRRQKMQMVFQDPYQSLNPRKTIFQLIADPLLIQGQKENIKHLVEEIMEKVGLPPHLTDRYPHMLSGGQRQRVGIARALITRPEILVCDEAVSALDVSVQAQVLNLLMTLQKELHLTIIFIGHDLSVIQHISDRVLVMYLGKIMEWGETTALFDHPLHPYTQALHRSAPTLDDNTPLSRETLIKGEPPNPLNPPARCPFHERCPVVRPECSHKPPPLIPKQGRIIACHAVS